MVGEACLRFFINFALSFYSLSNLAAQRYLNIYPPKPELTKCTARAATIQKLIIGLPTFV
jgi:hypothetical protein